MKPTLYTYALSPYGMKVYWALILKGVPFDLRYVSPSDQHEIAFTGQKVVPVVQLNNDWLLDSGPICVWLDEQFPERTIAGANEQERKAILAADQWATQNIIGLAFRSIIDNDTSFSAFRNGRILANVMRKTSGSIPWWAQFIWVHRLRATKFVVNDASQVDRTISLAECRTNIIEQLEARLEKTGYVAGTHGPSYADASVFAQLACVTTLGMEGSVSATSSPRTREYYRTMSGHFDLEHYPELVPGWKPLEVKSHSLV